MAKNSMNFNLKMGLDSKNFKRGINEVQGLMNGFRSSLLSFGAAIGAGFSFGALFSELKEAALELDTAMNTLKNVSKETYTFQTSIGEVTTSVNIFGENLEYVRKLADTYGQDLAAITHGFAKFTAACNNTGLALEQQKYIYEQLTRAAAYYHLSAYESQNVMNAVVQMMSKGKIAAEELRRQLGNSLPGAFNLMAAAMGVSTAELDKLMKEGKVISAEVLPLFAQELEKVTKGGNFDSLQLSLNKLKNAWYDFTTNSDFATYFKKGVDAATTALDFLGRNFKHLISLLLSIGTLKLFQGIGARGAAEIQMMVSKAKELDAMLRRTESTMTRFLSKQSGFEMQKMGGYNVPIAYATTTDKQLLTRLANYNQKLLELHNLKLKVYGQPIFSPDEVAKIQSATNAMRAMNGTLATSTPVLGKFAIGFKTLGTAISTSLKQIAKATFYTAMIQLAYEGIMAVVDAITAANKEIVDAKKELDAIYNNYRRNFEDEVDAAEKRVEQARYYLEVLKDINRSEQVRQLALEKLAELVGDIDVEKIDIKNINEASDAYKKLADRVNAWADASIKAAAISVLAQEAGAALVNQRKAQQRIAEIDLSGGALTDTKLMITGVTPGTDVPIWGEVVVDTALGKERKKLVAQVAQYQKVLDNAKVEMETLDQDLNSILNSGSNDSGGGSDNDDDGAVEGIAKVYADYLKAKKELTNKLREQAITQEQFNEELQKLVNKTFSDAAATGEIFIADLLNKQNNNQLLTAMEQWYLEIAAAAKNGVINAMFEEADKLLNELNDEINNDIRDLIDNNPAVEEMNNRISRYHDYLKAIPKTFRENRNTAFDYGKSQSDILGEEYDLMMNRVDAIHDVIDLLRELQSEGQNVTSELEQWNNQLQLAELNANSFEDAMNLAKIREDISLLSEDLANSLYGGLQNSIRNVDTLVNAFDRLQNTLNDMDASGWDRFMAVFNTFTSLIDTAIGLYETFNSLQQLSTTLSAAEASEQAVINGLKTQELALASQMLGVKSAEIGLTHQNTIAKTGEAAVSAAAASASAGEAVAGATASGAKMPFPLNLLAIAAGVAAVVTALAAISKFEKGGIVGGNSTHGDRNIARVNSGEMILNKAQQGTLWNMLNGKGGIGGNVNFKIRGADLVGTIENYNSKKRG